MLIYIIPSLLTISVYYNLEKQGKFKKNKSIRFLMPFSILILMAMFRENIGVDYRGYITLYNRILQGLETNAEIGFKGLVFFTEMISGDIKVLFGIMSFATLINFLLAIQKQSRWPTFSIALFILMGYYNLTYNAVRYYYALSLVFLSYSFLFKKKYKKFVIIIIFAALFHKTALIVLPLALFVRKNVKRQYLYLIGIAIIALVFKGQIRKVAFYIYPSYLNSVYDGGSASIFNIIKGFYILALGYLFPKATKKDKNTELCYKLNILALIIYVCCSWIPELSRIGYYFNITSVVMLPNLFCSLSDDKNKKLLSIITILMFVAYYLNMLLQSYSKTIHLLPYETWLFP